MYAWLWLYFILIKSLSHPFESALDRPMSCLLLHPRPVDLPNFSTLFSFASQQILLYLKFKTVVIVQKIRILTGVFFFYHQWRLALLKKILLGKEAEFFYVLAASSFAELGKQAVFGKAFLVKYLSCIDLVFLILFQQSYHGNQALNMIEIRLYWQQNYCKFMLHALYCAST